MSQGQTSVSIDVATLKAWLDQTHATWQAHHTEFDDSVRRVERLISLLEGTAVPQDVLDDIRLLIAKGLLEWQFPKLGEQESAADEVVQAWALSALWAVVVCDKLPPKVYAALAKITSPEIAQSIINAHAVHKTSDPMKLRMQLLRHLAQPECQAGIAALLEDLRDPMRGWPALEALIALRDQQKPEPPRDVSAFLTLVKWGAVAAVGGVIGNRSDALFVQVAEYLRGAVARTASSKPSPITSTSPLAVPTQLAKIVPLRTNDWGIESPIHLELVRVPAGEFLMGSDKAKDKDVHDNEMPQHSVYLDEYLIGKYPITVAQFAAFAKANGYKTTGEKEGSAWNWSAKNWREIKGANWQHPFGSNSNITQKQDHPVTCVSWDDAVAFCKWLSAATKRTVQLPTEAQREA